MATAVSAAIGLTAILALAGPAPEQKCQAAKNAAAGKPAGHHTDAWLRGKTWVHPESHEPATFDKLNKERKRWSDASGRPLDAYAPFTRELRRARVNHPFPGVEPAKPVQR